MKRLISVTALLGCYFVFGQDYNVASIPAELKKNANTVIRQSSLQYTLNKVDDLDIKVKDVKSILTKAGEKNSSVNIFYDKYYKVSNLKVRIIDEFGKVSRTYSKKDFEDFSGTGSSGLYTDDRVLSLGVTSINYPYTIETTYEINTSDTAFIPSFRPYNRGNVSVENADVTFINKSGIRLRHKILDTNLGNVTVKDNGNQLSFSYANVMAVNDEKYAPDLETLIPRVDFSLEKFSLAGKKGDLETWKAFGLWYNTLLEPVSVITPNIQKEVDALQLSGTVSEKVKKLYQYMQDKTRYVNVAIGIGGWQPSPADDVRRKGYGDCKGLTNYMRVLLKAANIPAYYAIIYNDFTPKKFDPDFPKMGGNHVILMVPTEKGNVWLENTSQKIAFNHIGFKNSNRNVMLVKEDGIELMNTPVYKTEDSRENLRFNAKINEDLSLTGEAQFKFEGGLYDYTYFYDGLPNDDLKERLKSQFANLKFQNLVVNSLKNDRNEGTLGMDLSFVANNFSKKLNNDIFFPVIPLGQNSFYLDNSTDRSLPLEIPFAYNDNYEIVYTLPNGYKLSEIPKAITLESIYGRYELTIENQNNNLIVKRKVYINKDLIPKEDIKKYSDFRKKISQYDSTKLLITKN